MGPTVPYLMLLAVLASSSFALPPPKESVDYEANKTIDNEAEFSVPEKDIEDISGPCSGTVRESRAIPYGNCLTHLYVLAFTSGIANAGSDRGHSVELRTYSEVRRVGLYNRPGDDYYPHKGDLWKITISDFHFNDRCIRVPELRGVALTENSNDGWHVESVVTFLKSGSSYQLYTEDFEANHWIDGDDHYSHRRLDLSVQI